MRKALVIYLVALALVFTAFTGIVAAKTVTLKYWDLFTGGDKEFMDAMVNKFTETHPDIKIEPLTAKWENYYDFITTAMAGGNAPDVAIMHMNAIPGFAEPGALYPLDKWVEEYNIDGADFHDIPWQTSVYKGQRYAIPLDVHPLILYYNKNVLRDAGIIKGDEDFVAPTNKADWIKVWSQVKEKTGKTAYLMQINGTAVYRQWFSMLYQGGGQLLTDDNTKAAFNTQAGRDALQFIVDVAQKYQFSPDDADSPQTSTMFKAADAAFEGYGVWRTGTFSSAEAVDLGTDIYPQFFNQRAVWANSHTFVMPRQRRMDTDKIKAAMEFIDWMTKHAVMWAKAGHIPSRKSVVSSEAYQAMPNRPMQDPALLSMVRYAPAIIPILEIENSILEQIQAAAMGQKDVDKALAAAEDATNRILARN